MQTGIRQSRNRFIQYSFVSRVIRSLTAHNHKARESLNVNIKSNPELRQNRQGLGKKKTITKGVVYNFSIKLVYTESAQNNDQRSDG